MYDSNSDDDDWALQIMSNTKELTHENWNNWFMNMDRYLRMYSLRGYLDGTETSHPRPQITHPEQLKRPTSPAETTTASKREKSQ